MASPLPSPGMTPDRSCLFCQIVAGELPATVVLEDERTVAFMDINPSVDGHTLVVPRTHSTDLTDVEPDDLAACMRTAKVVAGQVMSKLDADGVNILQNTGRAAGQAVFHFHVHVIPRYADDPLQLPWLPEPADPDELAAVAAELRR
jgi:histidine triad (HIT) family protein